jgi:hypothetical protein
MKEWAEKRMRQLQAVGEKELAEVFQIVIKICELEDEIRFDGGIWGLTEREPYLESIEADVRFVQHL